MSNTTNSFELPSTASFIPGTEDKYAADIDGKIYSVRKNRELKQSTTWNGYKTCTVPGFPSTMVHRMVLSAHIGECPDGFVADHIDCDPSNNSLDNLRWVSKAKNFGRRKFGKRKAVTDELKSKIEAMIESGLFSMRQIAKACECEVYTVNNIKHGNRYVKAAQNKAEEITCG